MSSFPQVLLKPNEDRRVRRGHLWVFSNEVASAPPDLSAGDAVQFLSSHKEPLGTGYYNPHSLIAGRVMDRRGADLDAAFFEKRLRHAMDLRRRLYPDEAYRWVFGESDDLPGLVIDRYGDVCVMESFAAGIDKLTPVILEAMMKIQPWKAIVLRNDVGPRRLERLDAFVKTAVGQADKPHWFQTEGLTVAADLEEGQKTGFFFDQRANRRTVAALAKGKRVLDLFCHTGGFSLWAAQAGAELCLGVDNSEPALALARENAKANGFETRASFEKADVTEWLAGSKDTYDIIVVDPPNFVANKKQLPAAERAYVKLNAQALRRVSGDGFVASAICAQHVDRETFRQILSRAAHESGRRVRILQWGGQAPDHPVRPAMPETDYLKFALMHVS